MQTTIACLVGVVLVCTLVCLGGCRVVVVTILKIIIVFVGR